MEIQLDHATGSTKKINAAAVASSCFGVIFLTLTCWVFFHGLAGIKSLLVAVGLQVGGALLGIGGMIPGVVGLVQIRKSAERQKGKSAAVAGILVCGFILFYHGMQLSSYLVDLVIPEWRLTHPKDEALPGLAGNWQDPQTKLVHSIAWKGEGVYAVLYVEDDLYSARQIESQSWSNKILTWTYVESGDMMTFKTEALQGDQLEIS